MTNDKAPEATTAAPAATTADATCPPEVKGAGRPPRRLSTRRVRVLIVVAVVAVVVVVLLWGMVPDRIYEVRDVLDDPGGMGDGPINLKGIVTVWSNQSSNFTLADSNNQARTIEVVHSGAIPEGFGINVTAVVKGHLRMVGGIYHFESEEIQIGCPSKY